MGIFRSKEQILRSAIKKHYETLFFKFAVPRCQHITDEKQRNLQYFNESQSAVIKACRQVAHDKRIYIEPDDALFDFYWSIACRKLGIDKENWFR